MKKNSIIKDWLDKHGKKEILEQVKKEIEDGVKCPLVNIPSHQSGEPYT